MQLMGCNSYKVQLLVTSQDVDNYKQIKQDLDQLRSIVEKSELWVYKGQGPDETMDVAAGENEHKKKEVRSAFCLDFWSWYITVALNVSKELGSLQLKCHFNQN